MATLEELRSEGRKRVRVIKAEQVAAMIEESVHAAVEKSGLVPPDEVQKLVEQSRTEFQGAIREREAEQRRLTEVETTLQSRDRELDVMRQELQKVQRQLATAERSLVAAKAGLSVDSADTGTAGSEQGQGAPSAGLVMTLMQEVAALKANVGQGGQPAAAAATGADFAAAIEKLTGTLNDRLEKLGKKMGVSAAVEAADIKFDGLFKDEGKQLESNMDNITVKQKAGGGIAANLARLKKLKGS
jgi:DNA gyrase/topoisomerase IV subunit A